MRRNLRVSQLLTVPILAGAAFAATPPITAAAASDASCLPTPTLTVTHLTVTTVQNGPEFDGSGEVTVESNGPGFDLTATDQTGFVYDEMGSSDSTHQATIYDFGPGRFGPGDTRTYQLELHPDDSNACYDADTGVGDGTQTITKTLTVTYYVVGQGGEGMIDGATVPGSDPETPIPGAPTPAITGTVRVGEALTCSATVPAHDSVGYKWYVAGTQVGSGHSYTPAVADYKKALTCGATGYNNAVKPGPVGKTDPVEVGLGAPVKSTNRPGLDGDTRSGGVVRIGFHGDWSPKATSYSYQWFVGAKKIKGATSKRFKIPKSAIGKHVSVVVTASAPGHQDGHVSVKTLKIPF
ncbi:MAG TPA: hypothetical protein VG650_05790 [Mycobacteriales bacterium]|nr:hypothetical protein [Mycobacteriales bacterium]